MTYSEVRSILYEFLCTADRFKITSATTCAINYVDEDKFIDKWIGDTINE